MTVTGQEEPAALAGPPRRVTSADVAAACGVSRATVSYVLNDTPNRSISPATRQLVLDTAARLGHVPSASARALRSGNSRIVLALVPGFEIGSLFDRTLAILNERLSAHGYALLVHQHAEDVRPLSDLWRLVSPALVIATSGLRASEVATVRAARVAVVDVAELASFADIGRMQAEHLIGKGHQVLAVATPREPQLAGFAQERLDGVHQACADKGVPVPAMLPMFTNEQGAIDALDQWAAMTPRPTAICAYNDDIALMLWAQLRNRGYEPGPDVALIGVDDIPLATVGLTTIAFDVERFARLILQTVEHELGEGPAAEPQGDLIRLVERSST